MRSKHHEAHYAIPSSPRYLLLLRLKYLPQHPVLEQPECMYVLDSAYKSRFTSTYRTQAKIGLYVL
jgi:hypothetical protein